MNTLYSLELAKRKTEQWFKNIYQELDFRNLNSYFVLSYLLLSFAIMQFFCLLNGGCHQHLLSRTAERIIWNHQGTYNNASHIVTCSQLLFFIALYVQEKQVNLNMLVYFMCIGVLPDSYEMPCVCWKLNSGSLEEQFVLLITVVSPQVLYMLFYKAF